MTLDPRGLVAGRAQGPESQHRIVGCAACYTGSGFALPRLQIPYKQPLAEQCIGTHLNPLSLLCCGRVGLSDLCEQMMQLVSLLACVCSESPGSPVALI